jgi:hypothetical protein
VPYKFRLTAKYRSPHSHLQHFPSTSISPFLRDRITTTPSPRQHIYTTQLERARISLRRVYYAKHLKIPENVRYPKPAR